MKTKLSFQLFLMMILSPLISFSQSDIVVLNKDTVRCKILENSMDWISYQFGNSKFKITSNILYLNNLETPDNVGKIPGSYQIKFVKFYENPNTSNNTHDLMKKLDFSSNGPHFKVKIDSYSNAYKLSEIDTSFNRLYWFGLDFTQVKIKLGTATRQQYSQSFFLDCNDFVLIDERFKEFRNSFNLIIDTGIVINRNNKMELEKVYNKPSQALQLDTIRNILTRFPVNHDGVGLIVFLSDIDKEAESETFYVTFFDLKSKTVLLCLKETASAKGIGMGWHWTKAIQEYFDVLLNKDDWKKKYL